MNTRDDLLSKARAKLDALNQAELDVVIQFLDSISNDIDFTHADEPSWLTPGWFQAFSARLRAHHAISLEALSRTQFEAAFNSACITEGWPTKPAVSATHRFFDTTVTGPDHVRRRLSLKASAAKDMKPDSIHISKLTEAAWIQDERTQAGRRNMLMQLFRQYREATTSIIVLRAFTQTDGSVVYQLVEIPTSIFAAVEKLTTAAAQAATIPLPIDTRPPDFKIRVDRSDSKITLTGIRLAVCTVHGTWHLHNTPQQQDADIPKHEPA